MDQSKQRMKTNFDKLEAAGLVASPQVDTSKARTLARIADLRMLVAKLTKVETVLADLYIFDKPKRLKALTQVMAAVERLHNSSLPVGSKKHVSHCLNELTSLREGIYASNASIDKAALRLTAAAQAKEGIEELAKQAEAKLDRINAESASDSDWEEFSRKAKGVIDKNATEATKLAGISEKPFVIARVPVVPASHVSIDKLGTQGFKVENLGGYAVLHNQLVIGINPKYLLGDKAGEVKSDKAAAAIRAELDRLRKLLQKKLQVRLQLVSDKARTFKQGTWFWLMTDKDLDAFARAFPGSHVKIDIWGFAF